MNNQTWYYQGNSWLDRARLWIDAYSGIANKTVVGLLIAAAAFTVFAAGHAVGVKSADGCQLDHGQASIAVLAYRDTQDKLHCQIRMNPYFRQG